MGLHIGTVARAQLRVQSLVLQPQRVDLFLDARLFLFRRFFQTGRKGFNSAFILRDHTGQGFISGGKFRRRRNLVLHLFVRPRNRRVLRIQLLLCGGELCLRFRFLLSQFLPPIFNLTPGLFDLFPALFDLLRTVDQLFSVLFQFFLAVFQFLLRIGKLFFRVCLRVLILLNAVQVLLVSIVVFFFRFILHIREALLTQLLSLGL